MTEFTITLPVGYIIRDEIKAFRPDQWASYFDKICASTNNVSKDDLLDNIKVLIKKNYNNIEELLKNSPVDLSIKQLDQKLKPLYSAYNCPVEEKGSLGEAKIINLLQNYTDAIIKDTSDQTAAGDFHFLWKNLKCLIEVKNKKVITSDDISKFIRDVKQNKKINCGLMISLQTSNFPNKTRENIQVEIVSGKPIVYFYLRCDSLIDYPITLLSKLLEQTAENANIESYTESLTEALNGQISYLKKLIASKERDLKAAKKQLASLEDLVE